MIDYLLAGLSAGFFVFLTLFIISFITLGLITGFIHLSSVIYQGLFIAKAPSYRSRSLKKPDWNLESEAELPYERRIQAIDRNFVLGYKAPQRTKERRLSRLMGLNRPTYCDPAR